MKQYNKLQNIGIISDTHGILKSGVVEVFSACDLIIHAGDIDIPDVLKGLKAIAPVVAVRGNMDRGKWAMKLPQSESVEVDETLIYVLHDIGELDLDPAGAGISAVISGHTHRPCKEEKKGVLYLNPGSAGWPKSNCAATVILMRVQGVSLIPEFIEL